MIVKVHEFEGTLISMVADSYKQDCGFMLHPETYTINLQQKDGVIIEIRASSEDSIEVLHG